MLLSHIRKRQCVTNKVTFEQRPNEVREQGWWIFEETEQENVIQTENSWVHMASGHLSGVSEGKSGMT